MFGCGYRTPSKAPSSKPDSPKGDAGLEEDKSGPPEGVAHASSVRRSIGEWETGKTGTLPRPTSPNQAGPAKTKPKPPKSQEVKRRVSVELPECSAKPSNSKDRTMEARQCLIKAKSNLGDARNLRGDIKIEVTRALDRLYQLVKEAEIERKDKRDVDKEIDSSSGTAPIKIAEAENEKILKHMEENRKLLLENNKKLEEIKGELEIQKCTIEKATYASVTAVPTSKQSQPVRTALHSIVISSKDELETGEEVLTRVREAVNAKEGWVKIERVRKARDSKIIVGCGTVEERKKVRERIERAGGHLTVEEVKNKDPLLILRDVLHQNTDEDVLKAIRNQNRDVFHGLGEGEDRMVIKYRRKARNPHTNHIIMSVSPIVWKRALEAETVRIDLQRIRVSDQSPLVQCTRCLGYGHGKRFCKEPLDACSHCGGPHLNAQCADKLAGVQPTCRNCVRAKLEETGHNAFSQECPIRKKWDAIARSTVAYC